jgi:predicted amidohydrolase
MTDFDIVLRGGCVIDLESGLDAVRDVAIAGDRVARIGTALPSGRREADVTGQMVTAGFIDMHSHAGDAGWHVLVNGEFVVFEARLVTGARPGRPVRAFA